MSTSTIVEPVSSRRVSFLTLRATKDDTSAFGQQIATVPVGHDSLGKNPNTKILLLENVSESGTSFLGQHGYEVKSLKSSLPESELIEKVKDFEVIGIRSKTRLSRRVLAAAHKLVAIGCFCIGTDQVDLDYATMRGIAVFNSPFSNSRSVAELVLGEIIALSRQLGDRNIELHNGVWNKTSKGCHEIRGKTLGIVGYGHVGSQLSVIAESVGMNVIYHDTLKKMAMGNARQAANLEVLLSKADFVSCHVPQLPETEHMISTKQFGNMKNGSYLINASRGLVVDIAALIESLKCGRVAGVALDVYPVEPAGNGTNLFDCKLNSGAAELRELGNVILTPHIGGSTEEAQSAIGVEVAQALVRYLDQGATSGSVNLPEVVLRTSGPGKGGMDQSGLFRVMLVHKNVSGVLGKVNKILADYNIEKQVSDCKGDIAYLITDVSGANDMDLLTVLNRLLILEEKVALRIVAQH